MGTGLLRHTDKPRRTNGYDEASANILARSREESAHRSCWSGNKIRIDLKSREVVLPETGFFSPQHHRHPACRHLVVW